MKNDKNDDNCKKMKWLMTGSNHGTIDTCGENVSLPRADYGKVQFSEWAH